MYYIGIDISKFKHDCTVIDDSGEIVTPSWSFTNDSVGFSQLKLLLDSLDAETRIGLESTGHYGMNLKLFLESNNFSFMEFNPLLMLEVQLSGDASFTSSTYFDEKSLDVSNMAAVSGYTYSFNFLNIPCASTYYIRARCYSVLGGGSSDWCSTEQISAPPSNAIFNLALFSDWQESDYLALRLKKGALDYDFTRVVFTIYKGGVPVNMAYSETGANLTSLNKLYRELYKSSFGNTYNGVRVVNLETGDYLGIIRVYYDVGDTPLQPVDESGNEVCFMQTITVHDKKLRPETFEWDSTKTSGGMYNLTASEWQRLIQNVNAVREYKGLSDYAFTSPEQNVTLLTADIYNEARIAINEMGNTREIKSPGNIVFAELLNNLRDDINNTN